jgi:glutamine amidotransferase
MIHRLGHEAIIAGDPNELSGVAGLILPGVGSFDAGMTNLERFGFVSRLEEMVLGEELPILGICLGMQLMSLSSEEGRKQGLGWIKGHLARFRFEGDARPIPHMGWNEVTATRSTKLFPVVEENRFYFVHSYHLLLDDPGSAMTKTHYGYDFVSSVNVGNIFGVQFHPEKSHRFGMRILGRFLEIVDETARHSYTAA